MAEKPDDHKLVLLLQKGDVEAFDSLFEIYSPKLFGFSMKYFKNDQDAEELVQEVFVQVWEHRTTLKSEYSFKSYLFTIALNRIRKFFNKRASSLRYMESLKHDPDLGSSDLFRDDDYDAMLQKINQLIEQMPPRRREIFTKSKLEGKSAREVAAELNISAGTVDNQVSEALKYIRTRISNENATLLLYAALFIF